MKFLVTLGLLTTLSITNSFAAQGDASGVTGSVSGAVSWIALSVYAPNVALGLGGTTALGYSSMSLGLTSIANEKAAIKNAVNTDAQDFFNNGTMSEALAQTIKQMKKGTDLSDSEALDLLIKSINE